MPLNRVDFPAPLGPMSPRMPPSGSVRETSRTATSPPNWMVMFSVSSAAGIASPDCPPVDLAHYPARHEDYDEHDQRSIDEEVRVREYVAEQLGRQRHQDRTDERTEDGAASADDRDQGDADRQGQLEHQIGRAHVLNSSHVAISYAVFCLKKKKH